MSEHNKKGGVSKMTKTEFISAIAEESGLTKKQAEASYEAFVKTVVDCMKKGDKISLIGFGNFEVSKRAARDGINPLTKEKIRIEESKTVKFKPSSNMKKMLNE